MKTVLQVTIDGNIVHKEDYMIGIYEVYSFDDSVMFNHSTDDRLYIVDPRTGDVVTVLSLTSSGGAGGSSSAALECIYKEVVK